MKKFMLAAAGFMLFLGGLYYAVYYGGFYVDLRPRAPITVSVKTEGKSIFLREEDESYFPFIIRGIDLPSSIPGHNSTDYAVTEDMWIRWFGQIKAMGANTVRVYTIYDDSFYNAFCRFNEGNEQPLYLLQGLQVSDYASHNSSDAYGPEFYPVLKKDSIDIIDVLHGRKNISLNSMKGSGSYRRDVSKWVLGYIIGNEWDSGTIAYTNNNNRSSSYQGVYLYTTEDATAFEAMLAKIMDDMLLYESKKYKTQKLISFQNDPENDPFEYETDYAKQLGKYNLMDAGHIQSTSALQSGYFASYRLYDFCPGFSSLLSSKQKELLSDILPGLDRSLIYDGYTQLLTAYHSMPVVITGYGFSSSRGTDSADGPLTEKEQGLRLVSAYNDMISSGVSGACITSWQDVWERRTWNTSYASDVTKGRRFHDIQTLGQGYGLLSFDPGKKQSVCVIDGNPGEWSTVRPVLEEHGTILSATYDERCLYLLLRKDGLTEQDILYIPIDITPESGSKKGILSPGDGMTNMEAVLSFSRKADFMLCLNGRTQSRLVVQERYEALRENYLMQTQGIDPFVAYPEKDSPRFVPIHMILKNQKLATPDMTDEELKAVKLFDTFETGLLTYGCGDPSSEAYNSLADFCYGTDCVEIRIPWLLLNFANPSELMVHTDYYEHYGVEWSSISQLYLGLGYENGRTPISMYALSLKGWEDEVTYHERLKESYYIVQQNWSEDNAH